MKKCISCNEVKSLDKFARNHKTADGYLKTCIVCVQSKKKTGYSLRKAIDAKCKDCIYDPYSGEGHWRQQVEACTSGNCPLYDVRPKSKGEG